MDKHLNQNKYELKNIYIYILFFINFKTLNFFIDFLLPLSR